METRHTRILEIVGDNERIEVKQLAELLKVSQVTVRKDLDILEEKGLLRREHGYAVMNASDDINNRLAFNYQIKRSIAKLAAELVKDGETVMIESGSSCALLAEELAANKKDVRIITNSAFIASYIREIPSVKIVLLGGDYQPKSQVMVGPITKKCAKDFFVDKLFVGTDGFTEKFGFTGNDLMRTETVQSMAESASHVVVLTDASKFKKQGVVAQFRKEEVDFVITDDAIPEYAREILLENNVELRTVKR
ncbi:DeoR/GlpR family DNA-binding transcription regulator [Clostridium vincentii]|uniref:DeoR/GlpR family DNA-binding transcription regulator n=1 Tax=Clostridium vincentii TaxID=52704 RepID=UPI000D032F9F|nr:DeoR/GlpR family DNA-binding transcription regulator [Clostridium vincentii]